MTEEEKAGATIVTERLRRELTENHKYLERQIMELRAKQEVIVATLDFIDKIDICVEKGLKP